MTSDLRLAEPRPWAAPGLLADVERALDAVPVDKSGAIVAFVDRDQAGLAVMARLGKGWSFVGRLEKPFQGELGASVTLVKFW